MEDYWSMGSRDFDVKWGRHGKETSAELFHRHFPVAPARPQWPEPKPGEDAWSVDRRDGRILFMSPEGLGLAPASGPTSVINYLNALYRGEVGPRDRWPS